MIIDNLKNDDPKWIPMPILDLGYVDTNGIKKDILVDL